MMGLMSFLVCLFLSYEHLFGVTVCCVVASWRWQLKLLSDCVALLLLVRSELDFRALSSEGFFVSILKPLLNLIMNILTVVL